MCLLCEELWMAFEPPPEAKPRTFVADSPESDDERQTTENGSRDQGPSNPSSVVRPLSSDGGGHDG